MSGVKSFTELLIWQRARALSKEIFRHTRNQPFCTDKRLVVQINDSSESVMANIAEGFGRGTQGEFILFLGYALGSLDETRSHLAAAYDRQYLSRDDYAALFAEGTEIRKMTVAFITSMVMPGSGVKHARKVPDWSEQVWEIYERVTGKPRPELFQKAAEEKREREEEAQRVRRRRKRRGE
ncbi:MAG: four helix bundle protein [Planctomycetota bacterium]